MHEQALDKDKRKREREKANKVHVLQKLLANIYKAMNLALWCLQIPKESEAVECCTKYI